jgi:hypothetical protein
VAATVASVRRIAPELASVSTSDVEGFLTDAALELDAAFWGDIYDRAHALVAAHLAAVAHPELAAPVGPIVSEAVGSVSRAYAAPAGAPSAGAWGTTRFGLELTRLRRQLGPAVQVV